MNLIFRHDFRFFFDEFIPRLRRYPAFYEMLLLIPETVAKATIFLKTF